MTCTNDICKELSRGKKFKALISIREDKPIKPEVLSLNGKEFEFYLGWDIEDNDSRYPGEHAMIFLRHDLPITWISCGDLILKGVKNEQS